MADVQLENINPAVFEQAAERVLTTEEEDENHKDKIDNREVFGILLLNFCLLLKDITANFQCVHLAIVIEISERIEP